MNTLLVVLALAGIAAVVWHLVRAAFRFLKRGADGVWTDELARTHARRGDMTAMQDARHEADAAARFRTRAGAETVGWLSLLLVPALTPWSTQIYAAYILLWIVPAAWRRRR